MTTRFGRQLKNANNLFNAELLRGGRVTPQKLLDTYEYSQSRKFAEVRDMDQNIKAARLLGVPEFKIRQKVKRQGISKEVFNNLMRGVYTPDRPSDFFVRRMNEITRDLNQKEKVDLPNPYFQVLPTITKIVNENRNIDLQQDQLRFPETKPVEDISIQETQIIEPLKLPPSNASAAGQSVKLNPPIINQQAVVQDRGRDLFDNSITFGTTRS